MSCYTIYVSKEVGCIKSDERIAQKVLESKGFSVTVIDNLLKRVKKVDKYSSQTISEAIMLRSISKKAYETRRKKYLSSPYNSELGNFT